MYSLFHLDVHGGHLREECPDEGWILPPLLKERILLGFCLSIAVVIVGSLHNCSFTHTIRLYLTYIPWRCAGIVFPSSQGLWAQQRGSRNSLVV